MRIRLAIVVFTALLVGATSLMAFPSNNQTKKAEKIAKQFVFSKLAGRGDSILTTGKVRRFLGIPFVDSRALRQSGVLSETVGLTMVYAVAANDRALFDRQLGFVNSTLVGPFGLYHWKVSHNGKDVANVSASVDDLRIANALILAHRNWSAPRYGHLADKLARNIATHEVVDNRLCDFLNWREQGDPIRANQIQLSYIDTIAMRAMVNLDPAWEKILSESGKILLGGRFANGLFYESYDLGTGTYQGENQNMINQLYCALFAVELEQSDARFSVWLRDRFKRDGKIYAQYDCATGEPTLFYESTSVYALAARYANKIGDHELEKGLIDKLLSFQNGNRWSPMYGGFYDDEVYSFDNVEALITLRLHNGNH